MGTGLGSRVIGPALSKTAAHVKCSRKEQDTGTWLEASHDGYTEKFGLLHRRHIYMDLTGNDIRGEDSLSVPLGAGPLTSEEIPFEVRFHLHPDVRATLAQDQKSGASHSAGRYGLAV